MRHRLGRRGAALAILGVVYTLLGVGRLFADTPQSQEVVPGTPAIYGLWVVCGAAAVVFAFVSPRDRVPDWPGFVALSTPATIWAFAFLWSWVLHLVPGGGTGVRYGLTSALVWVMVIALVAVIAGWREPPVTADER